MNRARLCAAVVLAASLVVPCFLSPAPEARAQEAKGETELISPQVESAVNRGLEWLAKEQDRSGAWQPAGGRGGNTSAITGLAVLAFMARGHVPGQGPYGDNLNRGIDAILSSQSPDGILASPQLSQPMYDHGICTIALCEAYGMLDDGRQARARNAISKAVHAILDAQGVRKMNAELRGGWRYTPNSADSDMSVSGWQFMALRGARNAGAYVSQTALDEGIAYITRQAAPNGGFYYRQHDRTDMAMAGTGILTLTLMGKGDTKAVHDAADFLLRGNFNAEQDVFYAYYYCSQAAYQLGGVYWESLSRTINTALLSKQAANGAWHPAGLGGQGGDCYATSMAVLSLAVPYRYLPIYQK